MNFISTKKMLGVLSLSAVTLALTACASGNIAPTAKQSRYVGYSSVVSINGQRQYVGGSMVEYDHFQNDVALARKARSVKSSRQFVGSGNNILFTTEFAEGSFETNFGKAAELIFSFQPCNSISGIGTLQLKCMDQNAPQPTSVRRVVTLKGGESVQVAFPNGIEWKYRVFDQSDINMPEN